MAENVDFNTNINIYDLKTGEVKFKTDFKGTSSELYNFNNTVLRGSSRGLHIYECNKNVIAN